MKQYIFTETGEYRQALPNEYYKIEYSTDICLNKGIRPTTYEYFIIKLIEVEIPKNAEYFCLTHKDEQGYIVNVSMNYNLQKPKPKVKVYKWLCESFIGRKITWITSDFFSKKDMNDEFILDANGVNWTHTGRYTPILDTMKEV